MKTSRCINVFVFCLFLFYKFFTTESYAQSTVDGATSKFYARASGGYGLGMNGFYAASLDNNNANNNINNSTNTSKLGNGLYGLIAGGCQLNSSFGFDLGFGYLLGLQKELQHVNEPASDLKITLTGQMFQMVPSIVYTSKISIFSPYLRAGLILALPEIMLEFNNTMHNGNGGNSVFEEKARFTGGLALGVQRALGCHFQISNTLSLFAEATLNGLSYTPQKSEIYLQTIDGADQLQNMKTEQKQILYKPSIDLLAKRSQDQPMLNPLESFAYGSFNINIGIKMNLGPTISAINEGEAGKGFYARIDPGYGLEMNGDFNQSYSDIHTEKSIPYSFGSGWVGSLGAGYMLTQNLGFDLGFNYAAGLPTTLNTTPSNPAGITTNSMNGNMMQVVPSLVFATRIWKLQPYARFGFIAGMGTVYLTADDHTPNGNTRFMNEHTVWKYEGGLAFGYNTTIGAAYAISHHLDIFAEVSANTIYYSPEKATMTAFSWNGVDYLYSYNTQEKNTIYKSNWSSNDNTDKTKPMVASPIKFNFNTIVPAIGLRVRI